MAERSIGVLALQGGVHEHLRALHTLGISAREIRLPADLATLDGLIIPGGESTTIVRLADLYGLREEITKGVGRGMALWGTCAGMIVIARELTGAIPKPFGLLDITVSRNWYGRQVDSFELDMAIQGLDDGLFHGVFIRAPAIVSMGPGVERLATIDDTPVAVRSGMVMGTAFHPELTNDTRLHRMFMNIACG